VCEAWQGLRSTLGSDGDGDGDVGGGGDVLGDISTVVGGSVIGDDVSPLCVGQLRE
jgi:hypothetical protein